MSAIGASFPNRPDSLDRVRRILGDLAPFRASVVGDGVTTEFTFTHDKRTRALFVAVQEAASPWELVFPGVEFPTPNTVKVTFAVPPAAGTDYILLLSPI